MYEEIDNRKRIQQTNEKKKKIIRAFLIICLCIIVFLGGRASAQANKSQVIAYEKKDWNLLLVNSKHPVPANFSIDLIQLANGQAFDKRAYHDLQDMMDDARAAGLSPRICSSYRTMEKQTSLYNHKVEKYQAQGYSEEEARLEAGKWVALPGTSEHQIGLAVDIISEGNQVLDRQQENTPEQIWLMKYCCKYGFILRYPADKSEITGISYEPWHYRYVGKEAAAEISNKGLCLEEYLDLFQKKAAI